MARDRTLVRASDLSAWAYCNRAWWLANVKQVPHQHPDQLERGTRVHEAHGAQVRGSARLLRVGWMVLLLGVLLLIAALLGQWIWA